MHFPTVGLYRKVRVGGFGGRRVDEVAVTRFSLVGGDGSVPAQSAQSAQSTQEPTTAPTQFGIQK